ncbi:MAG: branched-chain amino acid ABC transporter permease [Planctomycetota bacterium]
MVEILVYGTVQSAGLLLMTFGFSLVYGISRLPNFAHGALFVFTGYAAWLLRNEARLPYWLAAALALLAAGLLGVLIYQLVLKRIRGMEMSEVIATYAIGLLILESLRWRGLRGTTFTLPVLAPGAVNLLGVPIDYQRIAVVLLGFGIVGALWILTKTTRLGLALRGVAQDEQAAMLLGIDTDLVATVAVGLGSVLAGAGALILFPLGSIVVQSGYQVLVWAIAVCVVGGLGSWAGTVVACLLLGFAQHLTAAYGKPHYQMVVMLLAIIVTLVIKPSGLLGRQKELEERV